MIHVSGRSVLGSWLGSFNLFSSGCLFGWFRFVLLRSVRVVLFGSACCLVQFVWFSLLLSTNRLVPFVRLFTRCCSFGYSLVVHRVDDSCKWWTGVVGCSGCLVQSVVWLGSWFVQLNIYLDLYFLNSTFT